MLIYLQMIDSQPDKDNFELIYHHYRQLMFRVAKKILHSEAEAEDAVHQALISMIKLLHGITDVYSPQTRSLVILITQRRALDMLRANSRATVLEFDEAAYLPEIPPPGDHALADAMAALPPRYREVLLLRYDNGYTAKELARMLDMREGAVRKLLQRAKEALKKQLEGSDLVL